MCQLPQSSHLHAVDAVHADHAVDAADPVLAGSKLADQYRSCELRALVSSRLMGLDQKILHLPPIEGPLMEAKRLRFLKASEAFCASTGVSFGAVAPSVDSREELIGMKLAILDALKASKMAPPPEAGWKTVSASAEARDRFAYVRELERTFSDNLSSVVLYGSAVFGTSPGDYDNYVIVRDLERAYEQADRFELDFLGRPVHLNLFPDDLAKTLLTIAAVPSVRSPWLSVLSGEAPIPELPCPLIFMQGRARAMELIERRRELLVGDDGALARSLLGFPSTDARAIFGAIAHLPAVMIEWTRMFGAEPDGRPLTKSAVLERLRADGVRVPKFCEEAPILHQELQVSLSFTEAVLERARFLPLDVESGSAFF